MIHSKTFAAVPPGETIKEQLTYRGMSQKEFAARMDMSEKHICRLLKGEVALTSNVALRLEMVLGLPADFWEKLEIIYRENIIRVNDENQLDADLEIAKKLPYHEMVEKGWISNFQKPYEKVVALRQYFEVSKLQLIDNPQINRIACRRLAVSDKSDYALLAWAQKAKLEARKIETSAINISKLENSIGKIRDMSVMPPKEFCQKLKELLKSVGVALIFLPHIKGSFLHGASFYDGKKIVVGLTVRGKYADKFWFSLFHEIGHIIYGHIGQLNGTTETDEKQADNFARDILIPPADFEKISKLENYSAQSLKQFAEEINIDVGILIGRLQTEGLIKFNQFNNLKTKYQIG